ncbi:MAG TPA: tetratricopeptide repeat protein, partial [Myxococcales bacterium]|nr:tetratricopeptide repeat protein [Myxococcales bacterium]
YKPLEAEAELLLAQVHGQRRELAEAQEAEHRAAQAAEATGQLDLVVQAWTMLVRHAGLAGSDPKVWDGLAWATLGRLSGDTRALKAALLRSEAAAAVQLRQYDKGRSLSRESLAVAEQAFGRDHPLVAEALGTLATSCWYLGDLDTALAAHERAVEMELRDKGADHPGYAAHLMDVAGILIERGDWERGLKLSNQAEVIYQRTMPAGSPYLMMTSLYRIIALAHLEVERGTSLGVEATVKDLLKARAGLPEDDHARNLRTVLALVYRLHGRCAEAVPLLERAVAASAPGAVTAGEQWDVAENREHLGACLLATGAYARARIELQQTVKFFEETGTRNFLRAEGQLLLAQAEWAAGAREAARKDAGEARDLLPGVGPRGQQLLPEAERWLASH